MTRKVVCQENISIGGRGGYAYLHKNKRGIEKVFVLRYKRWDEPEFLRTFLQFAVDKYCNFNYSMNILQTRDESFEEKMEVQK